MSVSPCKLIKKIPMSRKVAHSGKKVLHVLSIWNDALMCLHLFAGITNTMDTIHQTSTDVAPSTPAKQLFMSIESASTANNSETIEGTSPRWPVTNQYRWTDETGDKRCLNPRYPSFVGYQVVPTAGNLRHREAWSLASLARLQHISARTTASLEKMGLGPA